MRGSRLVWHGAVAFSLGSREEWIGCPEVWRTLVRLSLGAASQPLITCVFLAFIRSVVL